jgi:hypothetical protein
MRRCRLLLLRIVETEPPVAGAEDDDKTVRRRIDAARRRKYSLFDGTPQSTRRKTSLFSDVTDPKTLEQSRKEHNRPFASKEQLAAEAEATKWKRGAPTYDPSVFEMPKKSREELLREHLEANTEFCLSVHDGGEDDIDLGGMPTDHYHNHTDELLIPAESALNQTLIRNDKHLSKSKWERNSWAMASYRDPTVHEKKLAKQGLGQLPDGGYVDYFPDETNLEEQPEYVQHTVSIYTKRKLYVDGLTGYHDMMTQREERNLCSEALKLLKHPSVEYIPEECRYCANVFDNRVGLPGAAPMAFAISEIPTLKKIVERSFRAGLLPSIPNTAQINEMVGPYAGYPPHRKHLSFGPYLGVLNLVSPVVLHMRHIEFPWGPSIYMLPRSLYVFQHPALSEYRIGYSRTQETQHMFRMASRMVKDYRIEILLARVDATQVPYLSAAVKLTEYANSKANQQAIESGLPSSKAKVGSPPPEEAVNAPLSSTDSSGHSTGEEKKGANDTNPPARLQGGLRQDEQVLLAKLEDQLRGSKYKKP